MTHRPIRFARALSLALVLSGALAVTHAQDDRVELRWLGTAATAPAHDLQLCTANPDDFRGIEGLEVRVVEVDARG